MSSCYSPSRRYCTRILKLFHTLTVECLKRSFVSADGSRAKDKLLSSLFPLVSSSNLQPVDWLVSMLETAPHFDLDRCLAASVGHHDPAWGSPVWERAPLKAKGHPAAASPPCWLRLVSTPPQHTHASSADWALASLCHCSAGGEEVRAELQRNLTN